MDTCLNEEPEEKKAGLTRDANAKIGIITMLGGLGFAGLDLYSSIYLQPGTHDARILQCGSAVLLIITLWSFFNQSRFKTSVWEKLTSYNPAGGVAVCAMVAVIEIARLFHLTLPG